MVQQSEKYQNLINYLRENPKASTYREIYEGTGLSKEFIRNHRTGALKELQNAQESKTPHIDKEKALDSRFKEVEKRLDKSLITRFDELKAEITKNNGKGEANDMDEKEIKQIMEGISSGNKELVKDIVGGFKEALSPLMEERQEKKKDTERQKADKRVKEIAEQTAKETLRPTLKEVQEKVDKHEQMLCDEKGKCIRVSTEEFEKFKATKPESQDLTLTKKQFLQALETTNPQMRKDALDTILASKEIKPLEIIDMSMQKCKGPEACEEAANLLCEKFPDLCTLVQKKFKEKK